VLFEFMISALCLLFSMFGLLHLSELGFLSGLTEQASFFAARSEFVGLRGERSGKFIVSSARSRAETRVKAAETGTGREVRVSLAHRSELPFFFSNRPVQLIGLTDVPRRSGR
jgi:hypothetical protein